MIRQNNMKKKNIEKRQSKHKNWQNIITFKKRLYIR